MTLIDGKEKPLKMIGVINSGDADCNSGFWGSVYLRPDFIEIGGIISSGDTESTWEIKDGSWYAAPEPPILRNRNDLCGGRNSKSPLETHLSHALAAAMNCMNSAAMNCINCDEDEEEGEDEECEGDEEDEEAETQDAWAE